VGDRTHERITGLLFLERISIGLWDYARGDSGVGASVGERGGSVKTQELGLAAIVVTVCLAFFASVILSAVGRPVEASLQGVINTTFTAFAVVVPTWLAVGRSEQQKREAFQAGLKEYGELRVGK
jgi:hypothetical protein